MSHRILTLGLLTIVSLTASLRAADEGGTVTGIVASKGDTWLGVKAEGQDDPSLFMPYWKGTGFDNEMLAMIKGVAVGSKVKLVWKSDEHPRIVSLETLAAPEKPVVAEKRPEKHNPEGFGEKERMHDKERMVDKERMIEREKERMAEKERMVAEREKERMGEKEKRAHRGEKGSVIGVVVSKGEAVKGEGLRGDIYIEVKPDANTPAEKYYPRYSVEEAGPDREIMRAFQKLKVGEWVKMDYMQDERRRATKVERAPQQ
jgi:hypothetical protein